jgi:dipeptidyl aminopeptidase/acylaminoacyl peptidase
MQTAPYGTWASPISASLAAGASKGFLALQTDGDDLYWLESRPLEGGRSVLMRADGSPDGQEITPAEFNVRTRVHEYGGASFHVAGGTVYFSNFADQALYVQEVQSVDAPRRLSKDDGLRYADCEHDGQRNRLICVREDHRGEGEAVNALVSVATGSATSNGELLWGDSDFVAYPRLNAQGTQLAWISWDHPNMPWDNVALWLADVDEHGGLVDPRRLNGAHDESVIQPAWADDGTLYFLSDRSGWWNLHRFDGVEIMAIHDTAAEFGGPLWGLGADYFTLVSAQAALVNFQNSEGEGLGLLSLESGVLTPIELPFSGYGSLQMAASKAFFLAGRGEAPGAIVEMDLATDRARIMMVAGDSVVDADDLSHAQAISFSTDNGQTAFAYYYPPVNSNFTAPAGELPPLLVLMHGGPTGATSASFGIAKQYWTSRGIAIVDVNYRGSTGYGRDYRQQLNGQWGVVDLQDAVAATQYLVEQGLADPHRLLIRGGSAGGYTTLSALAFTDVFAAGANYFGVADLEALAKHTHKFESRYLDSMVGPYPEDIDVYRARSPINALDGFDSPLITFQGLEDKVVPPAQSEMIYEAVKAKGTPTAYIAFAGEQHGFRKAENTIRALESELYFYGKVLGFKPHGDLPEVDIDNLIE